MLRVMYVLLVRWTHKTHHTEGATYACLSTVYVTYVGVTDDVPHDSVIDEAVYRTLGRSSPTIVWVVDHAKRVKNTSLDG